jgi:prophage antirepressor-like protein
VRRNAPIVKGIAKGFRGTAKGTVNPKIRTLGTAYTGHSGAESQKSYWVTFHGDVTLKSDP